MQRRINELELEGSATPEPQFRWFTCKLYKPYVSKGVKKTVMINKTLIFLSLAFIFVFASCSEKVCTDDGCPEFHELEVPTPTEDIRGKLDIEQWLESPKIELVNYQPINLEYGIHKVVEQTHILPEIDTSSNKVFVQSLNNCINYLYQSIEPEHQIFNELIIAQRQLSKLVGVNLDLFNEGNNLFGIRTWDIDEPHLFTINVFMD